MVGAGKSGERRRPPAKRVQGLLVRTKGSGIRKKWGEWVCSVVRDERGTQRREELKGLEGGARGWDDRGAGLKVPSTITWPP